MSGIVAPKERELVITRIIDAPRGTMEPGCEAGRTRKGVHVLPAKTGAELRKE